MTTMRSVSNFKKAWALLSGILRSRREMKTGVTSMNSSAISISILGFGFRWIWFERAERRAGDRAIWDGGVTLASMQWSRVGKGAARSSNGVGRAVRSARRAPGPQAGGSQMTL
ncbi:hypothetical protein GW17_00051548 [Ensete ventricosum]|nr:hypothetical protein GW17_00051548 [Ensete ventricosum]